MKGRDGGDDEAADVTALAYAGVAALLVSAHGRADGRRGGLTLAPARTTQLLYASARQLPCPSPRTHRYTRVLGQGAGVVESDARCSGPRSKNGFYGRGLVNAYDATR